MDRIAHIAGRWKYVATREFICQTAITGCEGAIEFVTISAAGFLRIERGFPWDGPSGPTVDTLDSLTASAVHDALYRLMRAKVLDYRLHRWIADREFLRLLLADGMDPSRARAWYAAVRMGAESAAMPPDELQARYELFVVPED